MSVYLFANNAKSSLAAPINTTATSLSLSAGTGVLFPNPTGGDLFALTLTDAATGQIYEIVYCTARTADTLTVTRAQEGTTALNWAAGDFANNFLTADTAAAFTQGGALGTMASQNANAVAITGGSAVLAELRGPRGTTGARPATASIGDQYYDTTIHQPIWCDNATGPVWVNAAGVVV